MSGTKLILPGDNQYKDPTEQLYGELSVIHEFFNERLFDGALPPCIFTIQRVRNVYGYFSAKRFFNRQIREIADEIAVNPAYFAIRDVKETLSTLVHEQVHQWQIHCGTPGRRGYHNMEFAWKMEDVGLMPVSMDKGREGTKIGDKVDHTIIPGGLFDVECNDLLGKGFILSWIDRYPPLEELKRIKDADKVSPDILDMLSTNQELEEETPARQKTKPSYKCPTCRATVWGKPGLLVICGKCKEYMNEEEV